VGGSGQTLRHKATFALAQRLGDSTSEPAFEPTPPERPPRRSLRGLLLLAGGLTLLLAIVSAASRGERVSPARGRGASETLVDYLLSTYLVVGLIVFVVVVYLLAKERETLPTKRSPYRSVRQLLQFAAVMVVLFIVGRQLADLLRGDGDEEGRSAPATTGASGNRTTSAGEEVRQRQFRWEPVILLGTLGLVSVAALLGARARRRGHLPEEDMADALASVLDDALADLRADRDLRRAVIAAYARMERLLAAHHVPRHPAEAPFEYLGRVLLALDTSSRAVFELTALFERAKFSRHAIDEEMRDEAIAALVAVRDELRGSAP
jgi:hypothetical protein